MNALNLRRLSQFSFFALFVFLFLNTEYTDRDILPYAVNIFLRADPLVAATASLAGRAFITLVWPALLITGLTLLLGRFVCGWVCPMGALLDVTGRLFGRKRRGRELDPRLGRVKYLLLAALAGSSLFSLQLVFLFDPISILIRSFSVSVYPALNFSVNAVFGAAYDSGLSGVTRFTEPLYGFLKSHLLAFEQPHFQAALLTGTIFLALIGLEYFSRRFWCRYLCPLGALFGLLGRVGLAGRMVSEPDCTGCGICRRSCRMDAIGEHILETDRAECIECLDCRALCPEKAITFGRPAGGKSLPFSPSRRGLLYSFGLGALAVPFFGVEAIARTGHPGRIRPPGALEENKFLARCTRCGECMRVCIANGLQPAVDQAGMAGLWSPVLVPRIGYCEFNCTLCGQVCPTGAIRRLAPPEKQKVKIGLAEVDRSRCLPWKGDSECIVCEEHCPTPQKAILLKEEAVYSVYAEKPLILKRPYVDETRCIGCGICETRCPLADRAAIRVTSRGESRAMEQG